MKRMLKDMEEEATALREMQAKVEKEMGSIQGFSFFSSSILSVECDYFLLVFLFLFKFNFL